MPLSSTSTIAAPWLSDAKLDAGVRDAWPCAGWLMRGPMNLFKENGQAEVQRRQYPFWTYVASHDDGKHPILDDSFSVNKGETIAFGRGTGSGKSSSINVLMRFYEFQSGGFSWMMWISGTIVRKSWRKTSVWSCRIPSSIMGPLSPISPCTKILVMSEVQAS